jgi:hypothetical protein
VCVYVHTHAHTHTHAHAHTHTNTHTHTHTHNHTQSHTQSHTHRSVLKRLEDDTELYSTSIKERKSRGAPAMKGMSDPEIRTALTNKGAALKGLIDAISQV